ncbi:MAG: Gfo/Idh/MocA family oxidoreductase [Oscillospiraceae bacterium]|nr:Gfo/Idh/MocA family oxidoreductase [Oscillospiraceae bacterium]
MNKIRMGVIGLGNMGSGHTDSLFNGRVEGMALGAVCDINPEKLEWFRGKFGAGLSAEKDIPAFDEAEKMMDSGAVDAVLIATPHYFHPPLAIAAFKRGLHVMSEKPAGVYLKQVREMNAAAKAAEEQFGVKFGMMFQTRTQSHYGRMRDIVQNGGMGPIRRTSWLITDWYRSQCYYDSGGWRATWSGEGGGVLLNQCPHNLDLWQWICGLPVRVQAFTHEGKWHNIEVEDDVTAYVEYPNGATGTFITSTADTPGANRFEVTMDGGSVVYEGGQLRLNKMEMYESEFTKINTRPFGSMKCERTVVDCAGFGDHSEHNGVLRAFAAEINGTGKMIAPGYEGINGLTLSNAMHLSSWLGRMVEIPFDDDLFLAELNKKIAASKGKGAVKEVITNTAGSYGS